LGLRRSEDAELVTGNCLKFREHGRERCAPECVGSGYPQLGTGGGGAGEGPTADNDGMSIGQNLLGGPSPTELPENPGAKAALDSGKPPRDVAAAHPDYPLAWALLAEQALADGESVAAYAYARTGYHRSLDQLRRSGWKGHGPVPWEHEPNRGFLRSLHALGRAASAIGEQDEAVRCQEFLHDSSETAAKALAT
jgi:hypothetical protein